eukprot:3835759-Pleurochrysis_carterae.AAC.3
MGMEEEEEELQKITQEVSCKPDEILAPAPSMNPKQYAQTRSCSRSHDGRRMLSRTVMQNRDRRVIGLYFPRRGFVQRALPAAHGMSFLVVCRRIHTRVRARACAPACASADVYMRACSAVLRLLPELTAEERPIPFSYF